MKKIFYKQKRFSEDKFNDATPIDHIEKLKEEISELKSSIFHEHSKDEIGIELADNLLCLFAIAAKSGFTYDDLIKYCDVKLLINYKREWVKMDNGTYKHK